MSTEARIVTAPSSASAGRDCAGQVLVSGSYGGVYNAYHGGKWGLRGLILNDAGVGKNEAGIRGLTYLETVGLPAATADANTCHIGDGDHMLNFGRISHVNAAARQLGCREGQSVLLCAELMRHGMPVTVPMPPISGGQRSVICSAGRGPPVIALDAAPMLLPEDAGAIVVTGSHGALFRGQPDDVVQVEVGAIFFSDAGLGLDEAGVWRLPALDEREIPAACASASSAEIGNARSIYAEGRFSRCNRSAALLGAKAGMPVKAFIDDLVRRRSTG